MSTTIKLITFATPNYEKYRQVLHEKMMQTYPVTHLQKTEKDIDENFRKENEHIFKYKRGYGYWIWKPYFILTELKKLESNELLLYMDTQDMVNPNFFNIFYECMKHNDLFVFNQIHSHKEWTKRDCFILMNCDEPKYHNSTQLEAGLIGVKNTSFTVQIVKEWLQNCQNENIITDLPNICGKPNFDGFKDHRHDQSILTNLFLKYDINPINNDGLISYHCN